MRKTLPINLQFFAEGGDGNGDQNAGNNNNGQAGQQGGQNNQQAAGIDYTEYVRHRNCQERKCCA